MVVSAEIKVKHPFLYREFEKARKGGLSEDDAWEVAYKQDSARRFTLAEKYYARGMNIKEISKKTGFQSAYLTKRLVFKER